jgi:haloalkane dehalogenase
VTKGGERIFQERVPGTKGQPHTIVKDAGHFLQEDASGELVDIVHRFIASTK